MHGIYIDTGPSDLWMVSDACNTTVRKETNMPPYRSSNIKPAVSLVNLLYRTVNRRRVRMQMVLLPKM